MSRFRDRGDNQITGLELLAISLGLSTFERRIRGRKVVIRSDNSGSEVFDLVRGGGVVGSLLCIRCQSAGGLHDRGPGTIGARAMASRRREQH